jgi:O-glycosyl hydrolase
MLAVFGVGVVLFGPTAVSAAGARISPGASSSATAFQVSVDGRTFAASLPVDSVATYEWAPEGSSVSWWDTTSNRRKLGPEPGKAQEAIGFGAPNSSLPSIEVDPSTEYQMMAGFGGAMTESAAAVIDKSAYKTGIITRLFTSQGAHFNIVRVPLGGSDFQNRLQELRRLQGHVLHRQR